MKIVKIVNREKIPSALMTLGSNKEIAITLNVNPSVVSNWISGKRTPSIANILNILEKYVDKITPEQLGVKIIESDDNASFELRLEELIKEHCLTQKEFSKEIGYTEGMISKWKKGIPPFKQVVAIANYFNVSVLYLLGETNIRDAENDEISNLLQCSEQLLNSIKLDNPNSVRSFLNEEFTAQELGEKYFDLKDIVFTNPLLLATLKVECDRVIKYYTSSEEYGEYEKVINENIIKEQTISNPVRTDVEKIATYNIGDAISQVFDKYVDMKLTEIYKTNNYLKNKYGKGKNDLDVTNNIKRNIVRYYIDGILPTDNTEN